MQLALSRRYFWRWARCAFWKSLTGLSCLKNSATMELVFWKSCFLSAGIFELISVYLVGALHRAHAGMPPPLAMDAENGMFGLVRLGSEWTHLFAGTSGSTGVGTR